MTQAEIEAVAKALKACADALNSTAKRACSPREAGLFALT